MFDVFINSVKTAPNDTAIILANKEKLNYQQVNELIGLWSKYFIAHGVGQGDRVAVLTEHEDLHPFIHLALDQINATVVPLDMEIPTAQLEVDLKNLNLKKILIDKMLAQRYSIPDSLKLYAPEIGITPKKFNVELTSIERDPSIPNYIVASSGVTQNKKWIPIRSAGISDWAEIQRKELQFGPQDKILCTRSPAYDARIWEYILGFAGGSTLVLLSHTQRRDLNAILEQCEQEKITSIILIASQLAIPNLDTMMKRLAKAGLKHLMVTGDACTDRLKQLCEQNDINLWNCYGPTEATFGSSILRVNQMKLIDENQHPVVPIGFPNSREVRFHLVDGCGYIESPFLSDGYLNTPEQTEKNFPVLSIDGRQVRVFNTQNRFTIKDGMLLFQGRIANDAHCKVSGVKVEPYAIQHCIEQYNRVVGEDVLHAYVVVKPWLNNYKPFAYVVVQKEFSKQQFMNYLKDWLRKEEIPIIIELDEFPRLIPSEKIDQRALVERVDEPEEFFFSNKNSDELEINSRFKDQKLSRMNGNEFFKAVDPLAKAWCTALGIKQSREDQEFMFLGGDSFQLNILLAGIQKDIDPSYTYQELISLPLISLEQIRSSLQNRKILLNDRALARALFPINPALRNYFFLPPLLGEGYFTYKELARLFYSRHQFNVYGLSDPSLFDKQLLPKSLDEAATRYVKKIREIQPKGPYYLLGFSFGSTLAYAVAKQLDEQNELVNRLHLVDGFPPALYQRLPTDAHADLLEELINFVIQTLNNRFYDEQLKSIRLVNFDRLSPKRQIDKAFNQLISKVKKEPSRLLLALARQHLSFMLEAKAPLKLPLWAQLYLSTPNQTYLNVIFRIPNIVRKSTECQSYFWSHYFEEVNLINARADVPHLDLLRPLTCNPEKSADIFWRKAHDPMYNVQSDQQSLKPFYLIEQLSEEMSSCTLYSLHWSQLANYKFILTESLKVVSPYAYPLYEQTSEKYKSKDRLFTAKYALSFIIDNSKLGLLHKLLEEGQIQQYLPNQSSEARGRNYMAQLVADVRKEPPKNILINLDVYWNGSYLMSLYFNCHADYKALLSRIYVELKMEFDDDKSQLDVNLFNFSHKAYNIYKPSIYDAVVELSHRLNHFISLLIPHTQAHCVKENRLLL